MSDFALPAPKLVSSTSAVAPLATAAKSKMINAIIPINATMTNDAIAQSFKALLAMVLEPSVDDEDESADPTGVNRL